MVREKFEILDTWKNTLTLWIKKLERIQTNIDAGDILVEDDDGNFISSPKTVEKILAEIESWTKYTADSVTLVEGTSTSSVTDLQTSNDGNYYHIDESANTPGINLIVDFVSVEHFRRVNIVACYVGSDTHAIAVQIYNWSTTGWDTFTSIQDHYCDLTTSDGKILTNFDIDIYDEVNYIGSGANEGEVRMRFYHTPSGNAAHNFDIDVVALYT